MLVAAEYEVNASCLRERPVFLKRDMGYRDNDLGSSTPERFDLFRGDSCKRLNDVVLEAARPFGV